MPRVTGDRNKDELDPRPAMHYDDSISSRVLGHSQSTQQRSSVACLLGELGE